MRYALVIICCFAFSVFSIGQQRTVDSLKRHWPTGNDTLELVFSQLLAEAYDPVNRDSAFYYINRYTAISERLGYDLDYADGLQKSAHASEDYSGKELGLLLKAEGILDLKTSGKILPTRYLDQLKVPRAFHDYQKYSQLIRGRLMITYAITYWSNGKYKSAAPYAYRALALANELKAPELLIYSNLGLGALIENDSSLIYYRRSIDVALQTGETKELGSVYDFTAKAYGYLKQFDQQLYYLRASLQHHLQREMTINAGWSFLGLGEFYIRSVPNNDSAMFYCRKAYEVGSAHHYASIQYWASKDLYDLYKSAGNRDSAFRFVEVMVAAREKVFNEDRERQFESADYDQNLQRDAVEKAKENLRNRVKIYAFLAGIAILLLLVIIFWRHSRRRQKAVIVLEKEKAKTEKALQDLKATQQQLIQAEKMASLGELTAGIAHEIQNPLNFVNNFSEVNTELLDELKQELNAGNKTDALSLADQIRDNNQKITSHGKRADSIVKGMLQHSRNSSGQKEPTDISNLVDECLRLSFHGMRAKDKAFNAKMETHFDNTLAPVSIVPQDIGRVFLNLFTNAFYSLMEKKEKQPASFEPVIRVSTERTHNAVRISVRDNGMGIPQKVVDKIFQPFFTTKPAGQGTGLGLSLSYDIIVKGHGGDLKVDSNEGEGANFTITIPIV